MISRQMLRRTFLKTVPALGLLTACSKSARIKLALNWKPEPEFGGFYAAPYSKHGLDVEILPGGAGTPTVQMVGAGSVDFGIVSADEVVLARSHGNDVVALFAVFQDSPTGIMAHASRNLTSIGDVLKDGTLALKAACLLRACWNGSIGFSHVKVVPSPGGDITSFLHDEKFAQQCFLTSEPIAARRKGASVKVFAVSEIGYNPYTTVLAVSGESLRKNPDTREGHGRGSAGRMARVPGRSQGGQPADEPVESDHGRADVRRSRGGAEAVH